ncbi:hypothetical protein [Miltoncostaea marina]|uniref:hypothetical protein n=1 Tax=Miltoncostaea marina TaxID=2843215 RepID=UPI001C3CA03D|nr:hypothetical protein [Miltoncostaea marina]
MLEPSEREWLEGPARDERWALLDRDGAAEQPGADAQDHGQPVSGRRPRPWRLSLANAPPMRTRARAHPPFVQFRAAAPVRWNGSTSEDVATGERRR